MSNGRCIGASDNDTADGIGDGHKPDYCVYSVSVEQVSCCVDKVDGDKPEYCVYKVDGDADKDDDEFVDAGVNFDSDSTSNNEDVNYRDDDYGQNV